VRRTERRPQERGFSQEEAEAIVKRDKLAERLVRERNVDRLVATAIAKPGRRYARHSPRPDRS
jgi:hypothetical protein